MKILNVIQSVRTHLKHLAFAVTGAGFLTGSAQAEMIVNVQFYVTGTTASMTDNQGPVASATTTPYWNQFTGANFNANISGYPGPNALNMADGTASGISLTMVGTWHPDGTSDRPGGQIPVFWGVAFMENSTETQTASFSGLKTDGTRYALYALGSVIPTADTRLTIGTGTPFGATPTAIRLRGAVKGFSLTYDSTMNLTQWVYATTDAAGDDFMSTANTAYFAELTPDGSGNLSVVVSYANDHRWNDDYHKPFAGVAGYQLVEISLPPATTPVITAGGSPLAALSTTYGTASTETSFTVSGTDMLEGILVTPPAGFEVSQTHGSGFAATTTVGGSGSIDTTPVYVRLKATAPAAGSYNGQDIRLTSSFASPVNVITAASDNTVTPKPLTVTATGPVTKVYGTTLVTAPSMTNFTAAGEVNSELVTSVTLTPDAAGASPTTAVGVTYTVTPSAATGTGGFLASNYNITYYTYNGTVVIGTPTLSVTNSPVIYDGSAHAAVVSASVPGTVSNVKYDGSDTLPAALGTYAVTADFAPADNTNYSSLTAATAGNFVIENMIVNVQFYMAGTNASMTGLQGPVASTTTTPYWNQFTGTKFHDTISGYPGPNALNMADGTASGISLAMAGNWLTDGTSEHPGGQKPVFWGLAFMENSSETQTALFSGLKTDGTKYALYALGSAVPTSDTRLTIGTGTPVGATPTAIRLRGAVRPGANVNIQYDLTMNLTEWVTTSTDAAGDDFVSTANTAYFAELTPDVSGNLSVVLSYANDHHWSDEYGKPFAGVAGYQLVKLAGTTSGNDYASWALTNGVTGGVSGDSNNDGVQNGIAYFMGLTGPVTNPGLDASNTVTWPMSDTFQGTYEVQISPDLTNWTPAVSQPTRNGDGDLVYTLPSGLGKQFVRLVVTPN